MIAVFVFRQVFVSTRLYDMSLAQAGYECLHKAGYTMQTLNNNNIGVFLGNYGAEWIEVVGGGLLPRTHYWQSDNASFLNAGMHNGRIAHCMGLKGPMLHADTACSSSLIVTNAAAHMMRHDNLGHSTPEIMKSALCLGLVAFLSPAGWIGQCAQHMLCADGRCKTFDASADGQNRGEGCSCVNIQWCDPWEQNEMDERGRLGMLAGTASNQDGKSASLTAPSGTAQQELHRISLRDAKITGDIPCFGECHGTGTPLGDAIEYGANRMVFGVNAKARFRSHALISSKAHLGHLEPAAGVCGLIKVVMMLVNGCTTANPHIKALNPNFEQTQYMVSFGSELIDMGVEAYGVRASYGGVASFAFGGANARGERSAQESHEDRAQ